MRIAEHWLLKGRLHMRNHAVRAACWRSKPDRRINLETELFQVLTKLLFQCLKPKRGLSEGRDAENDGPKVPESSPTSL